MQVNRYDAAAGLVAGAASLALTGCTPIGVVGAAVNASAVYLSTMDCLEVQKRWHPIDSKERFAKLGAQILYMRVFLGPVWAAAANPSLSLCVGLPGALAYAALGASGFYFHREHTEKVEGDVPLPTEEEPEERVGNPPRMAGDPLFFWRKTSTTPGENYDKSFFGSMFVGSAIIATMIALSALEMMTITAATPVTVMSMLGIMFTKMQIASVVVSALAAAAFWSIRPAADSGNQVINQ